MHKPNYWLLYGILPLMTGLFWLDSRIRVASNGHQWLQAAIVLLGFGLMTVWLRANQAARIDESSTQLRYSDPCNTEDEPAFPLDPVTATAARDSKANARGSTISTVQYRNN